MEFGNQHDTTDKMDFCPRRHVTDLLRRSRQQNWLQCHCACMYVCWPSKLWRPNSQFINIWVGRQQQNSLSWFVETN